MRIIEIEYEGYRTSHMCDECGAYILIHSESRKEYYGSTKNLHRRLIEHRTDARYGNHDNKKFQQLALQDPWFEVIFFPTKTKDEAIEKEQSLIDAGNPLIMLNVSRDAKNSMSGLAKLPEVKEQFRKNMLGNKRASGTVFDARVLENMRKRMLGNTNLLGHVHSSESRTKMSISRTGVKQSPEHTEKSANGRIKNHVAVDGVWYRCAADAGIALGLDDSTVSWRCRSDTFPGYVFVPVIRS